MKSSLTMNRTLLALCASTVVSSAALPEPDTVFYGRVLHLGGGEEYVMTAGELRWTVTPPEGSTQEPYEVTARLSAMKGGEMSYQVRIPGVLATAGTFTGVLPGLTVSSDPAATPFRNTNVTVNGRAVRMADPAGIAFDVSSLTRGSFRRLDFIFDGALPDSDGDGIPDWWEEKYNTDAAAANASDDGDSDGVNNLAEYRAGTDPTGADQNPKIASEILVSMAVAGRAVPVMHAVDADSAAGQLTYTIGQLPAQVSIALIAAGRAPVAVNTFTQADVDAGRVLITHTAAEPGELTIPLTLRDETPAHETAHTTLRLSVAADETIWEGLGLPEAARPDYLPAMQDATRLAGAAKLRAPSGAAELTGAAPEFGSGDVARLYIGSPGADTLLGSAQDDIISARNGDTVRAGNGADRILLAGATGTVTVTDFSTAQQDVIDLRGVLEPQAGRWLPAYVQMSGTELRVDANGDGSGYTDLTIRLTNAVLPADIADLWDSGALETGTVVPQTTLFLTTSGQAAEENLTPATYTLRRRGDVSAALDIPVNWSGTAVMGRDFAMLPGMFRFAAGAKTATLTLQPLTDDEREPAETVQLTLGAGAWIIADGSSSATLSIADLPSRVWLEIAERTAYKDSLSPAQILVRRSGPMAAPLTVQLTAAGRAVPALDYKRLPASVTFSAAQDTLSIDVLPLASATLTRGAEDVLVSVKADAAYLFGSSPQARVMIVERPRTLDSWMTARGIAEEAAAFLSHDADGDGLNGLLEFAFDRAPAAADTSRIQILRDVSGRVGIEFHRWPGAPELSYTLEQSGSLSGWNAVSAAECEETESEIMTSGIERVRMFLRTAPSGSGYLRVKVQRAE